MFWLPAVMGALQSNSSQTGSKNASDMQNAMDEKSMIAQKRLQRQQMADSVGNRNVDIDAIVNSLFTNRKRNNSGGFGGYGFFQ